MASKKKYTEQWYTQFATAEALIFHQLREFLFKNKLTDSNTKYACLKYCAMNTLFEYADEIIPDYTFEAEDLVELIDKFDKLKKKFEDRLRLLSQTQAELTEKVLDEIES